MAQLPPPPMPRVGAALPPPVAPFASDEIVAAQDVTKAFGDVVAVSGVTFGVGPGVTALLGPNGAGKSTLFRMLCGLTAPSQGTVRVFGADARIDRSVRGRIGLAPQQDALFDRFDAQGFVEFAAATQGLADPPAAARRALSIVELADVGSKPVGAFSKGMRQRVKLATALVNDPEVLVLDEPLTGLDPVQRGRMIELFHGLGDEGRCLLVSSHVLDEVARIGSRVLVIAQGRLAAAGDFRAIRSLMDDRPHRIRLTTDQPRVLAAALLSAAHCDGVQVDGSRLVVDTNDVDGFGRSVAPIARRAGVRLLELEPLDDDLESVFRYLVERR